MSLCYNKKQIKKNPLAGSIPYSVRPTIPCTYCITLHYNRYVVIKFGGTELPSYYRGNEDKLVQVDDTLNFSRIDSVRLVTDDPDTKIIQGCFALYRVQPNPSEPITKLTPMFH